jgi:hypothetical protein
MIGLYAHDTTPDQSRWLDPSHFFILIKIKSILDLMPNIKLILKYSLFFRFVQLSTRDKICNFLNSVYISSPKSETARSINLIS